MYPAMLNITDRLITLVGGGRVAYRKAKAFLEFGGRVRVISPVFYEGFEELKEQVELLTRAYTHQDLEESFLVVAATNEAEINQEIGYFCKQRRILCNVIDDIHLSSFIVPAYMKRGDLLISISTNGKSPSLASKIKQELGERYDHSYSEYLDLLGMVREKVVNEVLDEERKKEILHHIIMLDLEELREYIKQNNYC